MLCTCIEFDIKVTKCNTNNVPVKILHLHILKGLMYQS